MEFNWTRESSRETDRILECLAAQPNGVRFTRTKTEVAWRTLPFYARYRLYRLVNYATLPVFERAYLCQRDTFVDLDGTVTPIYAVNDQQPFRMDETGVLAYLDFVFGNVRGALGAAALVGVVSDLPTWASTELRAFRVPRVWRDELSGALLVQGIVHYGSVLFLTTIGVGRDGRLSFREQDMLSRDPTASLLEDTDVVDEPNLNELLEEGESFPPDAAIVAKTLGILGYSAHGQHLVEIVTQEKVDIRLLATPEPTTYLPGPRLVYVGFCRNDPPFPAALALKLVGVLREAEQELGGITFPGASAPREEHVRVCVAKHEDKLWYMCTCATELDESKAFPEYEFLGELRRAGHGEIVDLYLRQERK